MMKMESGEWQMSTMRRPLEKLLMLLSIVISATWPLLLGELLGGHQGLIMGALVYVVFGGLFLAVLIFGGIRGILGS